MKQNEIRLGIVVSQFNQDITEDLLKAAFNRLIECGLAQKNIQVIKVPGAIEIPLAAKLFAKKNQLNAIICLGAVIRGETSHYDYVCKQVSDGCLNVMMTYDIPVIFGVLTTENIEQARERTGGKEGHKGIEAADAALRMIDVVQLMTSIG